MKENKIFFENNRLNKGYRKVANSNDTDQTIIKKNHIQALPPLSIMEEYESLNPGATKQLFDMAQQEQIHRQAVELANIEKSIKDMQLGRVFAIVFVAIISITTLLLAWSENFISAGIFAASGFACIMFVSYLHKNTHSSYKNNFYKNKRHNKNYNNLA